MIIILHLLINDEYGLGLVPVKLCHLLFTKCGCSTFAGDRLSVWKCFIFFIVYRHLYYQYCLNILHDMKLVIPIFETGTDNYNRRRKLTA